MEVLKLTSIRLSESVLKEAKELGKNLGYYRTSDMLRVAIWVGLKFMKPGVLHVFLRMMWQEEINNAQYNAWDVLRAAGEKLEKPESSE